MFQNIWMLWENKNLIMFIYVTLNTLYFFATESCVEFDQRGDYLNWTADENATSPVTEFWELVQKLNPEVNNQVCQCYMLYMSYSWTCVLQEKSFECHRKCQWVRRSTMGVGSVSSVVLGHLLFLCLERSKVHWEGTGQQHIFRFYTLKWKLYYFAGHYASTITI